MIQVRPQFTGFIQRQLSEMRPSRSSAPVESDSFPFNSDAWSSSSLSLDGQAAFEEMAYRLDRLDALADKANTLQQSGRGEDAATTRTEHAQMSKLFDENPSKKNLAPAEALLDRASDELGFLVAPSKPMLHMGENSGVLRVDLHRRAADETERATYGEMVNEPSAILFIDNEAPVAYIHDLRSL